MLGCREPLPGLHEKYTATRWRQVLGSTMHCVAGDGLGILAGAILGAVIQLSRPWEISVEYLLGFGFGWTIFQALFMKASSGGSFIKALKNTFIPELVSMNYLMAAMVLVTTFGMQMIPQSGDPLTMEFWFVMSMALLIGFVAAWPINWWLVSNHLKHGMMTVRPSASHTDDKMSGHSASVHAEQGAATEEHTEDHDGGEHTDKVSSVMIGFMVLLSFVVFGISVSIALMYGS
ncbi:DUF4396 domain-containing protein [sulfur-oxidizing endosymbiont of Gigantopelta aegis]|uniref:DUF4396 domain-containing protein n=1 Tax=sulfur-oxidizing endosymbiont of Gigantopelta aegis TaxID=2794934 RepID=UPI001FE97E81|nr:DUF4396 domain-containing protein [sulfur-oxidizing endosymbiont of Gigantopelta aegis]